MSRRRVVYLSGTRADFGLMRATLQAAAQAPQLELGLIATGMHLSRELGFTIEEVRASGLPVLAEIPLDLSARDGAGMAIAIAGCLEGVTQALRDDPPDLLLLLGDRGEMLAGAIAALHLGIGCVHLHGGERSGTVDEPVRHAISKLATWHFVATAESRDRLLAMGEDEARIHVTGAPGLDGLEALGAMPRKACLEALGLPPGARFILALFHPVVQQATEAREQTEALRHALESVGLPVVWLAPNADAGSGAILQALDGAALPAGSRRVTHLKRPLFCAAMRHCELLAGNSSAGIIEAATFGTPVVNIGDRQRLRQRSANTLDCAPDAAAIAQALHTQLERGHLACENAWGDGHAAARIAHLLATLPLDRRLLEKVNRY